MDAGNPEGTGTKAAAVYMMDVPAGGRATIRLQLTDSTSSSGTGNPYFDQVFEARKAEADEFYSEIVPADLSSDAQNVMRQSFAGLLWSKQFYHYIVSEWLDGDPNAPPPPATRTNGRNNEWKHLYSADVISM